MLEEPLISLSKHRVINPQISRFNFTTNGKPTDYNTELTLNYTDEFFEIVFICENNPQAINNTMRVHNEPLYNQEVFEVFISEGKADSKKYLEIEINPNNAIWIGRISNETLGEEDQFIEEMVDYKNCGILHNAVIENNTWRGKLSIPWLLISGTRKDHYRVNFYRIRAKEGVLEENWTSNSNNCDFLSWSPTLSGVEPAFHRPKKFGYLEFED